MTKYRTNLPITTDKIFITDGGLETTLIFHHGLDLPHFAAFDLMREQSGRDMIKAYFVRYAAIARAHDVGMILESPTWRANRDWGLKMGYSDDALNAVNREAIEMLEEVRRDFETVQSPMVISGCIGPRGDGYALETSMTADQAQAYHAQQIETFATSGADMVTALTMTNTDEAIGIVRAAQALDMPVVIAFTVETDGRLPSGDTLKAAIDMTDAATGAGAQYFMINCAHPTHFAATLNDSQPWVERIHGVRANASKCSHAELDEAETLDDGQPDEMGRDFVRLRTQHHHLHVLGGCCGTDHRHIEHICTHVLGANMAA